MTPVLVLPMRGREMGGHHQRCSSVLSGNGFLLIDIDQRSSRRLEHVLRALFAKRGVLARPVW